MKEDAKSLRMLQDGLNVTCVKFCNPVSRFEDLIKKQKNFKSKKKNFFVNLVAQNC